MTKIVIADATDDQINAAIAKLNEWIKEPYPSNKNVRYYIWRKGVQLKHLGELDYLHSWALCGPLMDGIYVSSETWRNFGKYVYSVSKEFEDYSTQVSADTELRARCLAYLAMHFPDGMIEVDDAKTS